MNCKETHELLPLFVGLDLDDKKTSLITAHLRSCEQCADAEIEYRESQQLLRLYAPPPFSESLYSEIRQNVLREIRQEPVDRTLPGLIANFFGPRGRWAVASALLLAVAVSIFYVANRGTSQLQIVSHPSIGKPGVPSSQSVMRVQDTVIPTTPGNEVIVGCSGKLQQRRKSRSFRSDDSASSVVASTPDPGTITPTVSPNNDNINDPDAVATRVLPNAEKTIRVEMQTKDRNIRIIWFSPQRNKQDSPNKSTKRNLEVRSNA